MVSQERIGSPEALVIYFASITYHLQKALPIKKLSITAILSRHATRRSGTLQDKTAAWSGRPIPYELDQPIIVSSLKVPSHKGTKEALRDKTKSCCT